MKIKAKKKMNLHELIQWGWKNGEEQRLFRGSRDGSVCFNDDSWVTIETAVEPDETFTFEVEEEITEETEIHNLVEVYRASSGVLKLAMLFGTNIKDANTDETIAFYMLNDDYTMTLLWKDGEMVE